MVNSDLMPPSPCSDPADPEVSLALSYAPPSARTRLRALWALDSRLAAILRSTTDAMIGQMRFTWWHDEAGRIDGINGEPVLAQLAGAGFAARELQPIVEGWEALLDEPDDTTLAAYADGRGGGLFAAAAGALGAGEPVADAGAGWALVDLARHHSDPDVARRALALARDRLALSPKRWHRAGRSLGALVKLARRDLAGIEPQASPRRVLAAAVLALSGR